MTIVANGRQREVADDATIATFLAALGWKPAWVVAELNGEPVERGRFGVTALRDGDRLEVVRAVAGGAVSDRRARLARARLYLCVGCMDAGEGLERFLDAVLGGGVDVIQLRDKQADARTHLRAADVFRRAADRADALFVVNDRADLAVASGADGVHVGQDDLPPQAARALVGPDLLVGRSTHGTEEIARALDEPVDYLGVGPIRPTPTKPGREGVGLALVEHAARTVAIPWFVTGGIAPDTIGEAIGAGARRFVVVRALTEAADPAAVARTLRAALPADVDARP